MDAEVRREGGEEGEEGNSPSPKKDDREPPGRLKNEDRLLLCFPPPPPPKMEETPRVGARDRERERERGDFLLRSTLYFVRPSWERRETTDISSLSQKPIFSASLCLALYRLLVVLLLLLRFCLRRIVLKAG